MVATRRPFDRFRVSLYLLCAKIQKKPHPGGLGRHQWALINAKGTGRNEETPINGLVRNARTGLFPFGAAYQSKIETKYLTIKSNT